MQKISALLGMKTMFIMFTAVLAVITGCSSEENSKTNVPVASVQSIQPIGKSGQIILQFTQLAGMGANSEVQPEY